MIMLDMEILLDKKMKNILNKTMILPNKVKI